ncbi:MAG: hypothetical protein KU29_06855 [Sulfurovum sp. FS06-10]|nr:MAG: hypothetical protein KU29_06855 [Sulfurovum sp. FS06-10]
MNLIKLLPLGLIIIFIGCGSVDSEDCCPLNENNISENTTSNETNTTISDSNISTTPNTNVIPTVIDSPPMDINTTVSDSNISTTDSNSIDLNSTESNTTTTVIDTPVTTEDSNTTTITTTTPSIADNIVNKLSNWHIYDNDPADAIIIKEFDVNQNREIFYFLGAGQLNGYESGATSGDLAWNITQERTLAWNMKFYEKYQMYVLLKTTKGTRYIRYTNADGNQTILKDKYIRIGLGNETRRGNWTPISRDLNHDLKTFEPDNEILSVNGLRIKGTGKIDNLRLLQ